MAKKEKKQRKPLKNTTKLSLMQGGSVLSLLAPIGIVFAVNYQEYFYQYNGMKVSLGAMLGGIFAVMLVKGKTKEMSGLTTFGIVFLLAVLLQSILNDFVLISGMALCGKTIDTIFFEKKIKRLKRKIEAEEVADVNAEAQAKALGKALGEVFKHEMSGRV